MNLYKKTVLFFQEKLIPNCCRHNKYFRWFVIVLGIIIFCFVSAYNVGGSTRDIWKNQLCTFSDVFDIKKIKEYYLNKDLNDTEKTIIYLKGMIIGILIFVIYCGFKKGLIGISLGFLVGACLGIWISIGCPSVIYFLEFFFSGKIFS
ncbi:hypothetical protein [Candidatus Phytoplasma fraxini]|uniref:Uncharacterized protein n=1 Tax=Ash yellows phytoplasma TaxID=35780 RepID=A0ABZ2UDZ8_ASHYP